jgi:hypothetical protein
VTQPSSQHHKGSRARESRTLSTHVTIALTSAESGVFRSAAANAHSAADQCTQTRVDSAGIPQLPDPRRVFVTGDEIMVFFSGEKMRDMGFDDPAFLRASQ